MAVTGDDLAACRGHAFGDVAFRGTLGCAAVGVVEAVGQQTDAALIGRRVVADPVCVHAVCDRVEAGLRAHARDRSLLGLDGRDGVFADRFAAPVTALHPVPDHVDDDAAALAAPLAAAVQVLRQLTIEGRPYLTVLGDGRLGLLVAQLARELNATVRVVGRHDAKLRLCEKWGVQHRLLKDVGLHQDQDVVIDCSGRAEGFAIACRMVRPRGTVLLKTRGARGRVAPPAPAPAGHGDNAAAHDPLAAVVRHELSVLGSGFGPLPEAVDRLSRGDLDLASLVTRRMKLHDGVDALRVAAHAESLFVLLEP